MRSLWILLFLLNVSVALAQPPEGFNRRKTSPLEQLAANCAPATAATEMDINNNRVLLQSGGDMWWDLQGVARYEVPKNSGRVALFSGSLWLGGQDVSGQIKVAAQRYRGNGNDYWPGPLSTVTSEIDAQTCLDYDRHFVSFRDEVAEFNNWFQAGKFDEENGTSTQQEEFPNYQIPDIILNWPAHGRNFPPYDEDFYLAPFFDADGDGVYNPLQGDYPAYDLQGEADCRREIVNVFGDQNLWWVFNDKGNIHTESGAASIGMEIRAQGFAFTTNDEVNNMTFYNYELVNRSTFTLTDTYFGQWTDVALGDPFDDYVGCDVMRGLGYSYNGDEFDFNNGGYLGYGEQPPAVGVDFFQGPFQDNDGLDNKVGIGDGEALNGVGYGDGIIDNERFGMRRFLYHINSQTVTGDPQTGAEYYNFLRGIWRDGNRMTYGGTGYNPTDPTAIEADFMFPDDTDPLGWGTGGVPQPPWNEQTSGNVPADRRFVQSTGPFTLSPGEVNNITVGVVWARATSGGAFASVQTLRRADDKTQALFDNCFQILSGPDAPDMSIQELDKEIILYLSNRSVSNNFREEYAEVNPFQIAPDSVDTNSDGFSDLALTDQEKVLYATYRFQGYKVYQVKDPSVSPNDLENPNLARIIFQCDIKDGVGQLVNFYFDDNLGGNIPVEEVDGADEGVQHSFRVTEDKFAEGDKRLINHKNYYFMDIAYAYNNFGDDVGNLQYVEEIYDPNDPLLLDGQKEPYLESRKAATGGIRVYSGIPHNTVVESGGLTLNAQYGDGVEITRVEGAGSGDNFLQLKQESIDEIMDGPPWKAANLTYERGAGPVKIQVIDPLNIQGADYTLALKDSVTRPDLSSAYWEMQSEALQNGTAVSNRTIALENEQLLFDIGLSITMGQVAEPTTDNAINNGFIGARISYEDESSPWLSGLEDDEGTTPANWIRSGVSSDPDNPEFDDFLDLDDDEVYEDVLGGTWAPFRLVTPQTHGPSPNNLLNLLNEMRFLQSVDIVFTSDRSRWTRCPVLEMHDDATQSEGGRPKGFLRAARSVDQNGLAGADNDTLPSNDPNSPNYIAAFGMGWFPGYAINVETGERLNMAFGEDSWLQAENGRDMRWNPTDQITEGPFNNVRYGGKHYIYVFRNNNVEDAVGTADSPNARMPMYDAGAWMHQQMDGVSQISVESVRNVFKAAMWVGFPLLAEEAALPLYGEGPSNDATLSLRVATPYRGYGTGNVLNQGDNLEVGKTYWVNLGPIDHDGVQYNRGDYFMATSTAFTASSGSADLENLLYETTNGGQPHYNFNTDDLAPVKEQLSVAREALDLINIVPNPYYAYSQYEEGKLDYRVKIINLPQTCTVQIYDLKGAMIREFTKDDPTITSIDWNLENNQRVPIASGTYLLYIDVPGVGTRVIKWFGMMRPIDLDTF
ncbi:MAG: T9SS C-terminal target domain-containing protein [Salibacteraceae bacterium]